MDSDQAPTITASKGARKAAERVNDDDDDLPPEGAGDGELDAAIALVHRRAARTDGDDDDVSPTRDDDGQLEAAIALICKRIARVDDDDDDFCLRSGSDGQLDAALAFVRRRAARTNDDDDDISPTSDGDGEILAASLSRGRGNRSGSVAPDLYASMGANYMENDERRRQAPVGPIRKRAALIDDYDDDVPPTSGTDAQLDAAIALIRKRAALIDDDDDDVPPTSGTDAQLDAAIALIRKRAALIDDDDDDVPPTSGTNGQLDAAIALIRERANRIKDNDDDGAPASSEALDAAIALIRKRAALIDDDDDDVPPTSGTDAQLDAAIALIRARAARVDDDDDDVQPTSGGCGEVMAAPVRRGRGNKSAPVDVDDSINASIDPMDALFQVHLQRVRNSAASGPGTAEQRAQASARAARQRAEEEARLQQAQANVSVLQEQMKQAELKLALCEADERALDGLLSGTSRRKSTRQSTRPAVHSDADRVAERLLRARKNLSNEQARRQEALAVARTRMEAAAVQLIEVEAEAVAATQAEKEAADASANAWAQVHLARVRKSKARRHAEMDAHAARQAEKVEVYTQQAQARLDEAKKRLAQSEVELALCEADERALDMLFSEVMEADSLVRRLSESTESEHNATERLDASEPDDNDENDAPPTACGDAAPGRGKRSTSVAAGQDQDNDMSPNAGIASKATEASSGVIRFASRQRSERLARARERVRGRLGAERAQREAALAQAGRSRSKAPWLGRSPLPPTLRPPSTILSRLGPKHWTHSPTRSRSTGSPLTGSTPGAPRLSPPVMATNDHESRQASSVSPPLPSPSGSSSPSVRYSSPSTASPQLPGRLSRSLRARVGSRRRVAVLPPFVSCTHDQADRQGAGLIRTLPVAQLHTITTPAAALTAQHWLSCTMKQISCRASESTRTAGGRESDATRV